MKKVLATFFIATLILSIFVGCNEKEITIDAKTLVNIEAEGLSTKGRVSASPDKDIIDSVVKGFEPTIKSQQRYNDFLLAVNTIKYSVSPDQMNLSNGDNLSIKAIYDEELCKKAKLKIDNTEFTYTVAGLTEPVMVDPFAEIEIVYDGISPAASVEVINRSEKQFVRDIKYVVEPSRKLRIGDKIVVTAEIDGAKAEAQGLLVPDTLTKEYTVENMDAYITDFNDIDQTIRDKMQKESFDIIEKESSYSRGTVIGMKALNLWTASGDMFENTIVEKPELTNIYFNYLRQGSSGDWNNVIYYVYKVSAHYNKEPEARTAYAAVYFKNAVKRIDGSIDLDLSIDTFTLNIYAVGTSLDEVYKEVVTKQKESYEIQEIAP